MSRVTRWKSTLGMVVRTFISISGTDNMSSLISRSLNSNDVDDFFAAFSMRMCNRYASSIDMLSVSVLVTDLSSLYVFDTLRPAVCSPSQWYSSKFSAGMTRWTSVTRAVSSVTTMRPSGRNTRLTSLMISLSTSKTVRKALA